ncbi:MAG TPA: tRNA (adenosine(37)-N6)-dimethylallyltransferase MiaA [Cyclobacteriaceae bacterium]|nr:tRNA (adenosine(37)-N6)-dimethylallyltransferase MiaA [Cyclobacteriaceae bacterium]
MPERTRSMTLIVVAGPTAVGKTKAAIALAKALGTEIISADSRQVFREMRVGTARPADQELEEVTHHFVGSHSITEPYNAAAYGEEALKLIENLSAKYEYLILCGGSGLYIQAVCDGFNEIPDIDPEIRMSLNRRYAEGGLPWLQQQMRDLDPEYFSSMDQQNPQRIIRALEVKLGTGLSMGAFRDKPKASRPFSVVKVGLELERVTLYEAIDLRVDRMIEAGLFEEAALLYPYRHLNALRTVGYQEIFDHMAGKYDRDETIRLLKQHSRRYAKRQLTWFKRDPEFTWFSPVEPERILTFVKQRLRHGAQSGIAR